MNFAFTIKGLHIKAPNTEVQEVSLEEMAYSISDVEAYDLAEAVNAMTRPYVDLAERQIKREEDRSFERHAIQDMRETISEIRQRVEERLIKETV